MLILQIDTRDAVGRTLAKPIFVQERHKLFCKGHLIIQDDVTALVNRGVTLVSVVELEEGELSEQDAAQQVANRVSCGFFEVACSSDGHANVYATEPSCLVVGSEELARFNGNGIVSVATRMNFDYLLPKTVAAAVKTMSFCVDATSLGNVLRGLEESGSLVQVRPIRQPKVGVIYSDHVDGGLAEKLLGQIMTKRLQNYGVESFYSLRCVEELGPLSQQLASMLRRKPTVILVASTTNPSGPQDPIGLAMSQLGISIESCLAPVNPGALMMFGYKSDVPVITAPGCFRSAKPNVLDLVLPPVLARYRIAKTDIASLGHGGLMK